MVKLHTPPSPVFHTLALPITNAACNRTLLDNMERILARKPLTPAERAAKPAVVCVTGAAGFVASQITCRLLAAGHTVHATYREEDLKSPNYKALNELPEGIKKRLLWFKANLLEHDTYDAAVQGCK